jgi:hypothetical protein
MTFIKILFYYLFIICFVFIFITPEILKIDSPESFVPARTTDSKWDVGPVAGRKLEQLGHSIDLV